MPDYKTMYQILCSGVSEVLDDIQGVREYEYIFSRLKLLLNEAEDVYIDTANIIQLREQTGESEDDAK